MHYYGAFWYSVVVLADQAQVKEKDMTIEQFIYLGIAVTVVIGLLGEYRNWKKRKHDAQHLPHQ